ncbi:molybdopterin converting factor subunit 1 [Candidatus Viridilinea mediisalina]|uniref:molybdopterin converting factor subunit 1 n=1 Tax=Candidatus Viridilinea mediisalina TaxID=2024553 RepID=UPI001FE9FADC|nr:molybdopterin converting factor subunit 1 [Candidatus Viridilinea mediisalina]
MPAVHIRFFANHRDIVGQATMSLALPPGSTMDNLWALLCERYPRLCGYSGRVLFTVNQQFAAATTVLADDDEVAFIPPVSGG